jgi:hypothetical protein
VTTPAPAFYTQPPFSSQLSTLAFPLTNGASASGTLQKGYMIWSAPYIPGYGQPAVINYLYNPSTVSSDYNIADASAQASLNFPNPGDSAILAIPLSQTAQWTLMFDRTFEVWNSYDANGQPSADSTSTDASVIGVQADVLAFMQFTGMMAAYDYGTATGQGGLAASQNLSINSGIMQLVPAFAVFGSSAITNGLSYYGYINEWSVQYTNWTQFNVPYRAVISVNWTMLPLPTGTAPPNPAPAGAGLPQGGPGGVGAGVAGIGGR